MIKMDSAAVKAWAAEYKIINEIEREEMKVNLPNLTIEQSVREYFALCRLVISLSGSPDEPKELHELREREYAALFAKWEILAKRLNHVS